MTTRTNVEGHLSQSTTWRFSWIVLETSEMRVIQIPLECPPLIISKVSDGEWISRQLTNWHNRSPIASQIVYIKGVEGKHP